MKPIYFPFTYISGSIAAAVSACFKTTVVYQPSRRAIPADIRQLAQSGIIDARIPITGDEDTLDAILKDYNEWARINKGGAVDFLKAWGGQTPFFDETSLSQIQSEIRKDSRKEQSQGEREAAFRARLFLQIAQDLDVHSNELNRDLKLFDAMEQNFLKELKGEDEALALEPASDENFQIDDPGLYMTSERINAWTKLMRCDPQTSGIFVTASRAVIDELIERVPEIEMVVDIDSIPVYERRDETAAKWQENLLESLHGLVKCAWPVPTDGVFTPPDQGEHQHSVSTKFYIAAGTPPHEFFGRWSPSGPAETPKDKTAETIRNTLIGFIDLQLSKT